MHVARRSSSAKWARQTSCFGSNPCRLPQYPCRTERPCAALASTARSTDARHGHVAALNVLTAAMDGKPPRCRPPRGLRAARDWSTRTEENRDRSTDTGVSLTVDLSSTRYCGAIDARLRVCVSSPQCGKRSRSQWSNSTTAPCKPGREMKWLLQTDKGPYLLLCQ
jgi:hypothetical protein